MEWFFWYLIGLIGGGLAVYLITLLQKKDILLKWYEWLLGVVIMLGSLFTLETFVHSLAEMQVRAAWLSALFIGLPILILCVVLFRSIRPRWIENK